MNLSFQVNEPLLKYAALFGNKHNAFEATKLKNRLYKKHYNGYILFLDPQQIFARENFDATFLSAAQETLKIFSEFGKSAEYKELLLKTKKYQIWIEDHWQKHKNKIITNLDDILKIKLPHQDFIVYVIAPNLGGGSYLGDNKILWGHTEDWPNYSLVYLTHEYLHSFFDFGDIEHAVIELITDNELRIRLNGKGRYFFENGQSVGHDYLLNIEKKILPSWKKYLKDEHKNIYDFISVIKNQDLNYTD